MDRLYIPNFSVVLPGTEDSIWVYGGKGPTKAQARTSALMESIERYCSLSSTYSKNLIQGTYSQLTKVYNKVLHPDEVVERAWRNLVLTEQLRGRRQVTGLLSSMFAVSDRLHRTIYNVENAENLPGKVIRLEGGKL